MFQILTRHLTFLKKFKPFTAELKNDLRAKDCDLSSKNTVVTFPVLCKNEQSYAEVVDIMDSYEDHIVDIYRKANFNLDGVKVHIGGDQLTRERDFLVPNEFVNKQQLKENDFFICHQLLLNFFTYRWLS